MQNETHGATNKGVGGAGFFGPLSRGLLFVLCNFWWLVSSLTYDFIAQISLHSPPQPPDISLCLPKHSAVSPTKITPSLKSLNHNYKVFSMSSSIFKGYTTSQERITSIFTWVKWNSKAGNPFLSCGASSSISQSPCCFVYTTDGFVFENHFKILKFRLKNWFWLKMLLKVLYIIDDTMHFIKTYEVWAT